MLIKWHGHSFFELKAAGTEALLDPFIDRNPTTDAVVEDFSPEVVAVTHGHQDHLTDAHNFDDATVVSPEVAEYLGVDHAFPMHYNTFLHMEQDPTEFEGSVDTTVHTPESGESIGV